MDAHITHKSCAQFNKCASIQFTHTYRIGGWRDRDATRGDRGQARGLSGQIDGDQVLVGVACV